MRFGGSGRTIGLVRSVHLPIYEMTLRGNAGTVHHGVVPDEELVSESFSRVCSKTRSWGSHSYGAVRFQQTESPRHCGEVCPAGQTAERHFRIRKSPQE